MSHNFKYLLITNFNIMKYTIKLEFGGCLLPVQDMAANFGICVKSAYRSRSQAQVVANRLGSAFINFGMKSVKLWVLSV